MRRDIRESCDILEASGVFLLQRLTECTPYLHMHLQDTAALLCGNVCNMFPVRIVNMCMLQDGLRIDRSVHRSAAPVDISALRRNFLAAPALQSFH